MRTEAGYLSVTLLFTLVKRDPVLRVLCVLVLHMLLRICAL